MSDLLRPSIPLTITEISLRLKQCVEKEFATLYLQGEISGCTYHSSGHIYFSLKDDKSVLDAICWRSVQVPFPLKNGMSVVCKGRLTTYGARSKYQIIVEEIQHAGEGALLQWVEQLKVKLTQEGLFALERKRALPRFPKCIGLITSPTGAVIQDMLNRFQLRMPCRLLLYPVNVQGQSVVPDVLKALAYFSQCSISPDLLIIARGGGSVEDLWPFHDESLVRAVAASPIPIISAIGHETDVTLIDHAADVRAPTPTAAAEIALPLCEDLMAQIMDLTHRGQRALVTLYKWGDLRLESLFGRLKKIQQAAEPVEQKFDEVVSDLQRAPQRYFQDLLHRLDVLTTRLGRGPIAELGLFTEKMDSLFQRLTQLVHNMLNSKEVTISLTERLLCQLSYQKTLERGFALTFDTNGKLVTTGSQALLCSALSIQFQDRSIRTTVDGDHVLENKSQKGF